MSNSGQVCCATSRILVQENVYDAFINQFVDFTSKASVIGDPFNEDTSHGPQVSKLQYERVMEYVEKGKKEGAKLVLGGTSPNANFVSPTVFKDVEVRLNPTEYRVLCNPSYINPAIGPPHHQPGRSFRSLRCYL